jgi:hypothetical protein
LGFIVFYSIPSSKRSVYLLPAYPFMAFLVARYLQSFTVLENWLARLITKISAAVIVILMLLVFVLALGLGQGIAADFNSPDLRFYLGRLQGLLLHYPIWSCLILAFPLALGVYVLLKRQGQWLSLFICLVFSLYFSVQAVIFPRLTEGLSPLGFVQDLAQKVSEQEQLYAYGKEFFQLSFYLKRRIRDFPDQVTEGMWLLLEEEDLAKLRAQLEGMFEPQIELRSANPITKPGTRVILVKIASV